MRKLLIIVLFFLPFGIHAQLNKKSHFIIGTGASFSGNNDAYKPGFAYDVKLNLSLEYNFLEKTSFGLKAGLGSGRTISGKSTSTYSSGIFIRQYLLAGLNIQAAYLFNNLNSNLFQGIVGYSFYAGSIFIIEPSVEYGKYLKSKVNDDYIAFGLGFRFILPNKIR